MLSETTSNINGGCSCNCIDKTVSTIKEDEIDAFRPDLLVTFGGPVVSKMVKDFLRKNKPAAHWHIDPVDINMDTYQCLTDGIQMSATNFFGTIKPNFIAGQGDFKQVWKNRALRSESRHDEYLSNCEYSDLKVFETLLESIPEGSNLHLGNSTPVRYAQLFQPNRKFIYNSNRGTSGIDGTVSTAAGAAYLNNKPTTIITGDLGFLYDSSALMNHHLKGNLRIIIINNGGGGIFRFIPGPDTTNELEEFFEVKHSWNAKYIAKNFAIPYFNSTSLVELKKTLPLFYSPQSKGKPAILEIFTPNEKNAVILKNYFSCLKS
jgi:2-succinyl-5-enolpyruvyl-6-hydroxy-3-cyclohexene-1-carboxylate synthase